MTKQLLLNVTYDHDTNDYYATSYIKNKIASLEGSVQETIIKVLTEIDSVEMSYKGKPQGNIYIDTKDGEAKAIGYHYRVKHDIDTDNGYKQVPFTAWVTIAEVIDFPIEDID